MRLGVGIGYLPGMLALLLACSTTRVIGADPADDTADSGAPLVDTADEELPGPTPMGSLRFEPDGGTFVDEQEVAVTVIDGAGTVETCKLDPGETDCTWQTYAGPLTLTRSTILHARVSQNGAEATAARSFTEVEEALADVDSPLPLLVMWTDEVTPTDGTDVPFGLTVHQGEGGARTTLVGSAVNSGRARIHARGSSSLYFEKTAYDLELWEADDDADRNDSLLGLPDNGDWVLYAPYYYDEALVRNPLAFEISRALGRYAPNHRFVELYVADRGQPVSQEDYRGVYVLLEEIEVAPDRVAITPMTREDVAEPEVTGGYLFKIDRVAEGESGLYAGSAGGQFDFQQSFVAVQPSEAEMVRAQEAWLTARLDDIGWAIADLDGYEELVDVDSFIDHHIVNVVMKNPDAFRLSGYFHQDREGKVVAGPAWDFDRAAASQDSRAWDPTWWDNQNETGDCTAVFTFGWYEGLFADPEFSARYWARFAEVLDGELSAEALDAMIVALADGLDEPAERDAARWGQAAFPGEIEELRAWMATRHAWMKACIESEPDPRTCHGR